MYDRISSWSSLGIPFRRSNAVSLMPFGCLSSLSLVVVLKAVFAAAMKLTLKEAGNITRKRKMFIAMISANSANYEENNHVISLKKFVPSTLHLRRYFTIHGRDLLAPQY